jgi:hypothetical protein
MPFEDSKGRQEGVSCFFGVKEGELKRARRTLLVLVFPLWKRGRRRRGGEVYRTDWNVMIEEV